MTQGGVAGWVASGHRARLASPLTVTGDAAYAPIRSAAGGCVNWDAIGAIAELVGAAGVVASLVYLTSQIRSNSRSVEAATSHSIARARNEINMALATNPELSELLLRGKLDYSSLQPEERQRYNAYMHGMLNTFEDSYVQYCKGLASRESWEESLAFITRVLAQPGVDAWWRSHGHGLSASFREEVDSAIRKQVEPAAHRPAGLHDQDDH